MRYIDFGKWLPYSPSFDESDPRSMVDLHGLLFFRSEDGRDWNIEANASDNAGAAVALDEQGNVRFTAPSVSRINPAFGAHVLILPDLKSAREFATKRFDFATSEFVEREA